MASPPLPRDHRITLQEAIGHTQRFRAANPAPTTEKSAMFLRAGGIDELLAQKGCAGIRIYHGRDAKGAPAVILVGVDSQGNDLTAGTILEQHFPCPPVCPAGSPLLLG
jgi:hypothetical protein